MKNNNNKVKIFKSEEDDAFCMVYYKGGAIYTSETYKISDYKGKKAEFDKILKKFKREIKHESRLSYKVEPIEETKHINIEDIKPQSYNGKVTIEDVKKAVE